MSELGTQKDNFRRNRAPCVNCKISKRKVGYLSMHHGGPMLNIYNLHSAIARDRGVRVVGIKICRAIPPLLLDGVSKASIQLVSEFDRIGLQNQRSHPLS